MTALQFGLAAVPFTYNRKTLRNTARGGPFGQVGWRSLGVGLPWVPWMECLGLETMYTCVLGQESVFGTPFGEVGWRSVGVGLPRVHWMGCIGFGPVGYVRILGQESACGDPFG